MRRLRLDQLDSLDPDDSWSLGTDLGWREWLILLVGFGLIVGVIWVNHDAVASGGGSGGQKWEHQLH